MGIIELERSIIRALPRITDPSVVTQRKTRRGRWKLFPASSQLAVQPQSASRGVECMRVVQSRAQNLFLSAPRPAGLPQGCRKAPCLLISVSAAGSHQVPGQVPQINASPDQCSGIQGVRSVWPLGLSPTPCCWLRHQTATFMWSRQSCLQNKATELLTKSPSCQIGLHCRDPHCAEALRSAPSCFNSLLLS